MLLSVEKDDQYLLNNYVQPDICSHLTVKNKTNKKKKEKKRRKASKPKKKKKKKKSV